MLFVFDPPDRFIVGTIGQPGNRAFILQARQSSTLISMAIEKVQVGLLAERLSALVDGVAELGEVDVPPTLGLPRDTGPLDSPIEPVFRVGDIRIGWDRELAQVLIEIGGETEAQTLGVRLDLRQTQEFVARASQTVESGRPACPFCGQPIDPEGHICPRSNGYRSELFL